MAGINIQYINIHLYRLCNVKQKCVQQQKTDIQTDRVKLGIV